MPGVEFVDRDRKVVDQMQVRLGALALTPESRISAGAPNTRYLHPPDRSAAAGSFFLSLIDGNSFVHASQASANWDTLRLRPLHVNIRRSLIRNRQLFRLDSFLPSPRLEQYG